MFPGARIARARHSKRLPGYRTLSHSGILLYHHVPCECLAPTPGPAPKDKRTPIEEERLRTLSLKGRGSAFAEFEEGDKGTLAKGKLADIAVLSQDIFTVPADALPATESILTLVGGKVVRDAKALNQDWLTQR